MLSRSGGFENSPSPSPGIARPNGLHPDEVEPWLVPSVPKHQTSSCRGLYFLSGSSVACPLLALQSGRVEKPSFPCLSQGWGARAALSLLGSKHSPCPPKFLLNSSWKASKVVCGSGLSWEMWLLHVTPSEVILGRWGWAVPGWTGSGSCRSCPRPLCSRHKAPVMVGLYLPGVRAPSTPWGSWLTGFRVKKTKGCW